MSGKNEIQVRKTEIQEYLPKYGGVVACYKALEQEKRPAKIATICSDIDHVFGANPAEDTNSFMRKAVAFYEHVGEKQLISLAGYSHFILAEQMAANKFSKVDINKEIDKACALIDMAELGGKNPLLKRAMSLKRRVNFKDYVILIASLIFLALFILFIGWGYRFIVDNSDKF
ncbi:hypothetical protein TVAG_419000 [Trichomonas vaginalis G3]|uniref:Uncharacterized protein n=1 Tax=Trichomonas vaginalis (strain ATCC PRA-98 / G3) TaxID=412133 RepID=A2F5H1_TRIV3|nr:hypothetical protein TVAGG3_0158180 [Trichomonas vaginalis G3]EAX99843.1 hypothetical protein TVAG_419000 [Trichomonas vaginalis G3]KAI5547683.1 hypothetical protein TVAGG3_0158180 [Trichomonas vaginalis G3]|eukprot:XP_001312773.1 hypothetical protein [Trichomonas vaginalis G3]